MFETGDRIQVDRERGRRINARILGVEFANATYRAVVMREDNGQEDVFVWNIYQDEISVRKLSGEMSLADLQQLLKSKETEGFKAGFQAGLKEAKDHAYQSGYGPEEN